ncbi:MAG: hypothetical protein R6X02_16455 [Enhygromyxa sp.]
MCISRSWLIAALTLTAPLACSKGDGGGGEAAKTGDNKAAEGGVRKGEGGKGEGGKGGAAEAAAPAKKVLAVEAAALSTCALLEGGTVRCWGANIEGQLGVGKDADTLLESLVPVDVPGVSGAQTLWHTASYSWGGGHSDGYTDTACAQTSDGKMTCWGHNGGIMAGSSGNKNSPTAIATLAGVTDFTAASGHACGVWPDKSAKCWGSNAFGVAGVGSDERSIKEPSAVKDLSEVVSVGTGQNHSCALKSDGTVWCWGYASSGQLGNGQRDQSTVPVQVSELSDATQLAVATNASCALKKDASVVCWGQGFGNTPSAVEGATDITSIDAQGFMCGIKADKSAVCWGKNDYGRLGDGTLGDRPKKAAPVKGLAGVAQISVGVHHACALLEDGDVKCWGKNGHGQLGDGSLEDRHEPVSVAQLRAETLTPLAELPSALPTDGKVAEFSGVPEGCPSKVELEATVKGKSIDFTVRHLESEWNRMELGLLIRLRNYDKDEKHPWSMPRGRQAFINFGLEKWVAETGADGKEKIVQKPADMEQPFTTELLGNYRVTNAAGIYDNHKQRFFNAGQIKLTHFDDSWVCGEIDLRHDKEGHALTGKFVAPVPAKKKQ